MEQSKNLAQDFARAIREKNIPEQRRIKKLLADIRKECPHNPRDVCFSKKLPKTIGTMQKNGSVKYCKRCGKVLSYYAPGVTPPEHRPTFWEAILANDLV